MSSLLVQITPITVSEWPEKKKKTNSQTVEIAVNLNKEGIKAK